MMPANCVHNVKWSHVALNDDENAGSRTFDLSAEGSCRLCGALVTINRLPVPAIIEKESEPAWKPQAKSRSKK